ncbi:TLC domain-containing protein 4-B-like [Argopecten irradians]|uniref:TLC domain-containing protein 4-B-like n=1 Tax=Argopecten irradians TaxID=31199 RepID=UPI00371AA3B2
MFYIKHISTKSKAMEDVDYRMVNQFTYIYHPVTILSFGVVMFLYKKVFPRISPHISESYTSLSGVQQNDWNLRMTSCVHCVVISTLCLYTLLFDDVIIQDPVWSDRSAIRICGAIATGYFLADAAAMLMDYEQNMETVLYYFHHAATICASYYVFTYGILPYFANYKMMMEFSTLFVNLRWLLIKEKVKTSSKVFLVNGCLLTFTFVTTRVLSLPKFWYKIYSYIGSDDFALLGKIPFVMIVTSFVLDSLNIYWSIRILKTFYKTMLSIVTEYTNEDNMSEKNGKHQ